MSEETSITILVLMGLPGSGKSSFVDQYRILNTNMSISDGINGSNADTINGRNSGSNSDVIKGSNADTRSGSNSDAINGSNADTMSGSNSDASSQTRSQCLENQCHAEATDKKDTTDRSLQLVHVCYDQLIPLEVQRTLVDGPPGLWKEMRTKISQAVNIVVCRLLEKDYEETENEFLEKISAEAGFKRTLFIIDDNNQLASMRYTFLQIARKHSLGFAQLFFNADLKTAISLNKLRSPDSQVPESVISKMAGTLEPPDPFNNSWERFSFTINVKENVELNLGMVETVISTAFKYPEVPLEDHSEQSEQDRVLCSANIVHQADNHLRSLVNKQMRSLKDKNLSKQEMKESSSQFYSIKQEVLEDLKTGFTKLDRNVVDGVESREPGSADQLAAVISDLFSHKLNIRKS